MNAGDIISYLEMCNAEGTQLQRGMNYQLGGTYSILLMSVRHNSPYNDIVQDNGKILIYEGHDVPKNEDNPNPKIIDQPLKYRSGTLTQNGLFHTAAQAYKANERDSAVVKVYEKIKSGIWVYNGLFQLVDSWQETDHNNRSVFKFKLILVETANIKTDNYELEHSRFIPSHVKLEVWKRDKAQCCKCQKKDNLHFDHIIPYSRGGTSLSAKNIQLLCMDCNLAKRDRIE